MKERPIIFTSEMVQAILDGRKTQTRRVIKNSSQVIMRGLFKKAWEDICPYGQRGDRLWVKEAWWIPAGYQATVPLVEKDWWPVIYRASGNFGKHDWKSPIFMPRWVSRITLEITGVRVERVQDISEEDARAEGEKYRTTKLVGKDGGLDFTATYRLGFERLWDSLNAKRGYGWETNPWVWVIGFKRIKGGKA